MKKLEKNPKPKRTCPWSSSSYQPQGFKWPLSHHHCRHLLSTVSVPCWFHVSKFLTSTQIQDLQNNEASFFPSLFLSFYRTIYESGTIKKTESRRTDAFEMRCWRRLLRVPWTARRSNQSILKEINPEYSLEGLMLKMKLQYFGHLMQRTDSLAKTLDAGKDWRQEEKRETEDEMVGWHHRLNGHEFVQTLGDSERQGSLACCSTGCHKE